MNSPAPGISGVGGELARAREAQGLSLAAVAQQLKFGARQIEALEQERFDALPGGTFVRGMVRSYARLVRIDPEPLIERIAGRLDAPDASRLADRFSQPVPFSDGSRRSNLAYAALSIAILGAVAAVAYEWREERAAAARLAFVPAATATAEPARLAPALPAQTAAAGSVQVQAPAESSAPAAGEQAAPGAAATPRIVIRCERESWIEVKDARGRVLLSELNPAGCERVVEGEPPFSLVIGNAQHVRVTYDGQSVDLMPHVKVEVARLSLP
jgi:cytoskeleton protein RodZ